MYSAGSLAGTRALARHLGKQDVSAVWCCHSPQHAVSRTGGRKITGGPAVRCRVARRHAVLRTLSKLTSITPSVRCRVARLHAVSRTRGSQSQRQPRYGAGSLACTRSRAPTHWRCRETSTSGAGSPPGTRSRALRTGENNLAGSHCAGSRAGTRSRAPPHIEFASIFKQCRVSRRHAVPRTKKLWVSSHPKGVQCLSPARGPAHHTCDKALHLLWWCSISRLHAGSRTPVARMVQGLPSARGLWHLSSPYGLIIRLRCRVSPQHAGSGTVPTLP